jgi:FKBP-type peptidyl-prolyl cis-trans isomerase
VAPACTSPPNDSTAQFGFLSPNCRFFFQAFYWSRFETASVGSDGVVTQMLIRSFHCHTFALFLIAAIAGVGNAQDAAPAKTEEPQLKTISEKASYAIGYDIGKNLKRQGLELDLKVIALGITAAMESQECALSDDEIQEVFAAVKEGLAKKKLDANKKFLEQNKAKEGVKVTKSGLQYIVIKEGTGAKPTTTSTVSTHYRGTLLDGTVFDGSYKGDAPTPGEKPVSFGVTQVIKGWTEALQLMTVGSHYRLFIPSELAYGERGPGEIGPNSILIFDLYLVGSED